MRRRAGSCVALLSLVALLAWVTGCNPTPIVESIDPTSGPESGNNKATLTGKNFRKNAQVDFGGQVIPAEWMSRTQVSVTVPTGKPGTVDVTVINPKDHRAKEAVKYTYMDTTPPSLTSTNPTDGQTFEEGTAYQDSVQTGINTITATFSEDIQSAEITVAYEALPDAIKKDVTGTVNGQVSVSGNTATFTSSDGDFRSALKVTVTIMGTDAAGNKSEAKTITFSIATPKRVHSYTVKAGDTLKSIAARPETYDDESMATRILRVNQDYHELNRNRLKPGLRLILHW